jgi:hypothetical protein
VSTFVRITNGVANTLPGDFGRELERGCTGGVEERKKKRKEKKKKNGAAEQRRLDAEQRKAEAIAPWRLVLVRRKARDGRGGVWGGRKTLSDRFGGLDFWFWWIPRTF